MVCRICINKKDPGPVVGFRAPFVTTYTLAVACLQGMTKGKQHRIKIVLTSSRILALSLIAHSIPLQLGSKENIVLIIFKLAYVRNSIDKSIVN